MYWLQERLYRLCLWLLLPVAYHMARKLDREAGESRWRERFGFYPQENESGLTASTAAPKERPIWLHAASVGEAKAAAELAANLRNQGFKGHFVVTTTTPTGASIVRDFLGPNDRHYYAPFDLSFCVSRALKQFDPTMLVILEVEIWPNLWRLCEQQGVPVVLANARLSKRSLNRYQGRFSRLWQRTIARASLILSQSEPIQQRFAALGADPQRLKISGNLKFSQPVDSDITARGSQLREQLGRQRPVWLAASTHEGEEKIALECHQRLLQLHPRLLLVIVPRHPKRFEAVAELCENSGLRWQRRSLDTDAHVEEHSQLYLADSLGELLQFYSASDFSWVAGSFVKVGGHNILEPAACGCPIIVGPDMRNFSEILKPFLDQEALIQVQDPSELSSTANRLLSDSERRNRLRENAESLLSEQADTARRQAQLILDVLLGKVAR